MKRKEKEKLEKIMQDIRDFRDDVDCSHGYKGCDCGKYDEILDKLEGIKSE